MSRRLRRLPVLLLPIVLGTTLVACGDDEGSDNGGSGSGEALHGITITGDVGSEPEVEWDGALEVDETATEVVTEGDGDTVAEGDQVVANIWVGNGTTQEKAFSTYDEKQPETVPVSSDLSPVFRDALLDQTVGSRVAVTTTSEEAFGPAGNSGMGIGNKDTVLLVVDLMELSVPPAAKDVPQSEMPGIIEKGGKVTGLDFRGLPEPDPKGDLLRTVVTEGDGEEVTTDMTVKVNYLGSVYKGKAPFDESYSKEPVEFPLSNVVQGWTYGLEGVKVGSRVLLSIPPELGYGAQEQSGIPANSTLYFVVDVISAS
ncbi:MULTISPECIES: FKBP-type peptidyl-prolyl cis-trans isomerase [unclassified Nocardioides]|uniref:FKBP-type peptidyl-prolyl cis-trans isomerase n=1 Tax=unclassified Nocardioides TaxID=2615069 RepID=UPI00362132B2